MRFIKNRSGGFFLCRGTKKQLPVKRGAVSQSVNLDLVPKVGKLGNEDFVEAEDFVLVIAGTRQISIDAFILAGREL